MSAITSRETAPPPRPAAEDRASERVTLPNVIRSEWTKLWSLRSTRWSLIASLVAMIGLAALVSAVQMSRWDQRSLGDRLSYDSINNAVAGYHLAQLAIGVLGVLVISGEYTTGMIRSSMMAVPRRLPVLWAKLIVFAAVTFVLMLVASFIAFFIVQAIDTQHHVQHSIGDPGALRTVIGAALFLTVLGVMCIGLGGMLRNTAGGIATFVALLFVLPGISAILPSSVNNAISPYLPLNAGTTIASHTFDNSNHLAVWTGFALFCGYALVAVAGAAVSIKRRDA
ncbi:MAG TPA: ABC transporter permease subunit [Solirubrobacteraceae bacterium]|jgi:ABC-type transport system involved in multi-copper enzyme maturation permease subunit|nr:ABC transporter permease subunit [Solirubrobacteraceae bacterium]